jgi:hypothetical protein
MNGKMVLLQRELVLIIGIDLSQPGTFRLSAEHERLPNKSLLCSLGVSNALLALRAPSAH